MTNLKFVASTKAINLDTDVIAMDVRTADQIMFFVDEALNANNNEHIYVVHEDITIAQQVAVVLNTQFEKEMVLMKDVTIAKEEVNVAIEGSTKAAVKTAVKTKGETTVNTSTKKNAAAKFLEKHGSAIKNSQKASTKTAVETKEETKGETTMKTTTTMGARRQLKSNTAVNTNTQTEKEVVSMGQAKVEVKEEVKGSRRRLSSTATTQVNTAAPRNTSRRLARSAGLAKSTFVKHEGPWYLNASLYPVLSRFESIVTDMADSELGITEIALVEPTDISRYERKTDVLVVIQIKANGTVLEFPIKENTSSSSKSDLSTTSIGWVQGRNGMRPAFGFYRSNFPVISAKCTCGNELENVSASNIYCGKCKTRHEDATISLRHATLSMGVEEYTFQTIPNLYVPAEMLALVMAIAQYDLGFDMHGVVAE